MRKSLLLRVILEVAEPGEGNRKVEDYSLEMEKAMIRANIEEDKKATMTRFGGGLNHKIANQVELKYYAELEHMAHITIQVVKQLKRKGA